MEDQRPSHIVGSLERPGGSQSSPRSALQASLPASDSPPGHSIDLDWMREWAKPPQPIPENSGWYRRRAEDLGDLTAEMIHEELVSSAYGAAIRAAHFGRIALTLYEERRRSFGTLPPSVPYLPPPGEYGFRR